MRRLIKEMPKGWKFAQENLADVPEGYARVYDPENPEARYYIRLKNLPEDTVDLENLQVGDQVGRVILGDYEIATVTAVRDGSVNTDMHCWWNHRDIMKVADAIRQAEDEREKYEYIIPAELTDLYHMEYTRTSDGRNLWGQIGYYDGMLFWKHDCTYQFLGKRGNLTEKKWKAEYAKHMNDLADRAGFSHGKQVYDEHPMDRLYLCADGTKYASADYAMRNKPVVK